MTELVFRQAGGRVVRSAGPGDSSRAYVVVLTVKLFDEYARRIEDDMPASTTVLSERVRYKPCAICRGENALDGSECEHCNHPLPTRKTNFRACEGCGHLNPAQLQACQSCGASMIPSYEITVREALRDGVISRGVDLGEDDIAAANTEAATMKRRLINNPDDELAQFIGKIPKEILPRLRVLLNSSPA